MNKFLPILFLLACSFASIGQHVCGTTIEDQQHMLEFIDAFNKKKELEGYTRSADPIYVPVKFHMVAKTDGTGRIKAKAVLNQMSVMIEDYRKAGFYLYIDDYSFNYLNNTNIYENAASFEQTLKANKDPNAVNVFIAENADTPGGGGTTLGFYSPSGDYIIMRINDIQNATASLSHELGHFFALPHTFLGWELVHDIYDWDNGWVVEDFNGQVTMVNAPGTTIPNELVDNSNCTVAADMICDTPVDHNFGFGWSTCSWDETLLDRNGDLIETMAENYMGYFIGCNNYDFTEGQIDVMTANFNSNLRTHLRKDYEPDTTIIISNHQIIEPTSNQQLDYYDNVLLDWSDATGASHYLLSITASGQTIEIIVDDSEYIATELMQNTFYLWEVQPFNDGYTQSETISSFFKTGNNTVGVKESEIIKDVVIAPNPVRSNSILSVTMNLERSSLIDVSLIDISGKTTTYAAYELNKAANRLEVPTTGLSAGIYILKINTNDGAIHKKIVVNN